MNVGPSAAIVPFLIMLAFFGFIIYFLASVLRFMKTKNQQDAERNEKLDQLLQVLRENNRNE